jgi:hypothetical protein
LLPGTFNGFPRNERTHSATEQLLAALTPQAVGKDSGEYKYDDAKEVLLKSHKLGEYANHQSEEHSDGNNAEDFSSSRSKRKRSTNDADESGASGGPNKELRKALRGLGGLVRRYADNPADGDEEGAKKMGFASNSYLKVSRLIREHLDDNDIELSDPEKQLKHIKGIGKKSIVRIELPCLLSYDA